MAHRHGMDDGSLLVFGGLINGAAIVLYDGAPDYPDEQHIWSFIHDQKSPILDFHLLLSRSAMQQNLSEIKLPHVKAIISTGEPWNEAPWQWLLTQLVKSTFRS